MGVRRAGWGYKKSPVSRRTPGPSRDESLYALQGARGTTLIAPQRGPLGMVGRCRRRTTPPLTVGFRRALLPGRGFSRAAREPVHGGPAAALHLPAALWGPGRSRFFSVHAFWFDGLILHDKASLVKPRPRLLRRRMRRSVKGFCGNPTNLAVFCPADTRLLTGPAPPCYCVRGQRIAGCPAARAGRENREAGETPARDRRRNGRGPACAALNKAAVTVGTHGKTKPGPGGRSRKTCPAMYTAGRAEDAGRTDQTHAA